MKSKFLTSLSVAALLATSASAQVYVTSSTGELGTVNVYTGAFSSIGHQTNAAGAVVTMGDIAYSQADGFIYGNTYNVGPELAKISTLDASFTTVGATMYSNSLEFLNYGVLVANDAPGRNIHAIDTANGSTYDTQNFFGAADDGKSIFDIVSAPAGSSSVYGIDNRRLYLWANSNADAVLIGDTGFTSVFGLAWWDDVLWGFGIVRDRASVFSIDLATGAGTFSAFIDGGDFNTGAYVYGATSAPGAVPEPSTYGLIGASVLVGLVAIRRLKKSKPANS